MTTPVHTSEQGQRVHYLANLGGLVVIAGLAQLDPELLLGVLGEVASRVPKLTAHRHAELRAHGKARLAERGAEKRAWAAWQQAQHLHQVVLTTAQLQHLIHILGGTPPTRTEELSAVVASLLRPLREGEGHGTR